MTLAAFKAAPKNNVAPEHTLQASRPDTIEMMRRIVWAISPDGTSIP